MRNYMEEYQRWLDSPALSEEEWGELNAIREDEKEIRERFFAPLEFGTAGLRGTMKTGLHNMNIHIIRHATQAFADVICAEGEAAMKKGIVIAHDCRLNGRQFAEEAAAVMAANGIYVRIFDELRPTPELSFAVRYYGATAGLNDVVQQENAHLVAGNGDILAVSVANHGTHAVRVGVGSDNQVAVDFLCQRHGQIEAFGILGVRADHSGEVPVNYHLFRHREDVLHTQTLQGFRHQLVSAAVEGGVDDPELIGNGCDRTGVDRLLHHFTEEGLVGFFADNRDGAVLYGFFVVTGLIAGEEVGLGHALGNVIGMLRRQLCAV